MTHNIAPALTDRATPIARLHPHPQNARTRTPEAKAELQRSLEINGQYRSVIARTIKGGKLQLLAGHGTVEAARELGWTHVAAEVHKGVDDQAAARIVLADNRTSDLAGYDDRLLSELLSSMEDLAGSGYDLEFAAELDAIVAAASVPPGRTDPDEAPVAPRVPLSRPGDVWTLGPHRLVCGDATEPDVWHQLLDGDLVDAVWTDPPYGVSYQTDMTPAEAKARNRRTDGLEVANDTLTEEALRDLLRASLGSALMASKPGACWYVASPSGDQMLDFAFVLRELDLLRHTLVWVKDQFVFGRSDYHYRHETIFYGWKPGGAHHAVPDRSQDTVWEVDRPRKSTEHPTMKPVELITRALENSTAPGNLVADPFGGSGSTLMACHMTGRTGRLIELDPRYVDVICRRYQEYTGTLPILERTGKPVDFTKAPA